MLGDPCPNPPIAILSHSAPWRLQAVHRSASEKRSFADCTGALLIPRRLLPFLPAVQTFPALSGCPGPRLLPVHGWTGATEGADSWKGFRAEDSRSGQALVTFPMAWLEDPQEKLYLSEQVIVLLSCALSFLGSLLIICTHVRWPELRSRPRQLLLFLSVADLLSAASYFYGVLRDFQSTSWDCVAQGAVSTFSNTSSFFWTMAVALYLYITIVQSQQSLAEHMVYWFHLISWGIPLVITVAAVCLQKIGYDASYVSVGWCWVNIDAEDKLIWMLLTGKAWEILAYLVLPVLYLRIKKHIGRAHRALSEYRPILTTTPVYQPRAIADKKLVFIPIIFIFLRIWSTIRFILTLCDSPVVHNPILVVLHGIGNSFQGGANCIMFVLCTRVIRTRLLTSLRCCFCCKSAGPGDFRESAVSEGHASGYGSTGETQDNQKGSPHLPST